MKFGVREICDVVLKAKANQKVGNKIFYKNEPVIYFDTLKTSSLEGAATTAYAQGGRGNSKLMAWEGERTVTFTMEDALISPIGFMILSGAGLIEGSDETNGQKIQVHTTEQTNKVIYNSVNKKTYIGLNEEPSNNANATIYVMTMIDGEITSEPYIATKEELPSDIDSADNPKNFTAPHWIAIQDGDNYKYLNSAFEIAKTKEVVVLVDYYVEKGAGAQQIEITPDKFGGNYYLEASTLFRNTNGVDMPAEFIIPNCKIQSNFTFTMASSGDPSSFTFTMDAFPDYTRFDPTKKVLAAIQIITEGTEGTELTRENTPSTHTVVNGIITDDNDEAVTDPVG